MRFIREDDYSMLIKAEIIRILTDTDFYGSTKLVGAENTATQQIRHRIGKRYDCDAVFGAELKKRDAFMVTITIDIALYHLYSQTGMKDIPEHRAQRYQDALEWLADVGKGEQSAELPEMRDESGETFGEVKIWSIHAPENHKF